MAHFLFGLPPDFEGLVDAGGHLVEGDRQFADLVVRVRNGDSLLVVAGGEGSGSGRHLLERSERPAHD